MQQDHLGPGLRRRDQGRRRTELLRQLGDWKFDGYTEVPLFWLPGQAVVDPDVIAEYVWPGNVDAGFDHFEYIKAAN